MRAVLKYFRQHPWQRRSLTLSLAALVGVAAAWAAWPTLRDLQILRLLRSEDPLQRERGIVWAAEVGARRPELIARLESGLTPAGDEEFFAIAEVLARLGRFDAPGRPPEHIDRWRAVSLAAARGGRGSAGLRLLMLNGLILSGRDNAHVRRGLRLAAADADPEVRVASAVLAARLADDAALQRLLADGHAQVRAAAAIDAALAGRKGCVEAIAGLLEKPAADEDLASAAYALARLAPEEFSEPIAQRIGRAVGANEHELLDRLLHVAGTLGPERAGPAVAGVFADAVQRKRTAPAMAFVAAGRMQLARVDQDVTSTVCELLERGTKLTLGEVATLAAAINAGRRLKLPIDGNVARGMTRVWHKKTSLAMMLGAEVLGEGPPVTAEVVPDDGGLVLATTVPAEGLLTTYHVAEILRRAATRPGTPVPSAAAAVALFKIAPDLAGEGLHLACESQQWLAGDYVAWHLARVKRRRMESRSVATRFLRPEMYDKGVWSAAAILLAQLVRAGPDAEAAAASLEERLSRERDPFLAGSYQCALLTLGRRQHAGAVTELARSDTFPKRRALTALVLAGEPAGFDLVLGSERLDAARIDSFLTGRLMGRVYAAVVAEMPGFDIDAPQHVRHWQCRIVRDFYLIHRRAILDRMRS